jgi:hypothetical protein
VPIVIEEAPSFHFLEKIDVNAGPKPDLWIVVARYMGPGPYTGCWIVKQKKFLTQKAAEAYCAELNQTHYPWKRIYRLN